MTIPDEANRTLDCGKTVQELADYLETGRTPPDPHIESCPECLNALEALERAGRLARDLVDSDASRLPAPPESWFERIFATIHEELRAGRSFPISHPDPRVQITVTEGAVRALLRDSGDAIDGVFISRTEIIGDAETLGAPVEIKLTASLRFGIAISTLTRALRDSAYAALAAHTDLHVTAVNITVEDIYNDTREQS